MTEEISILSHLARVRMVNAEVIASLTRLMEERELFGDLNADQLFFWRAEISNTLLDSHYTHMSERTLANYAEDASIGVSFLKGHDRHGLALGYSLRGVVEEEAGRKRTVADFYTVRGLSDTDDLIARMNGGLVRDVSVGFHGGQYICDICTRDFFDCEHWPGFKYQVKEEDTIKSVVATFLIDDARLSEVSGVYDGSTPNAMVLKAQRMANEGRLKPAQVSLLEQRYRVKLPSPTRSFFRSMGNDEAADSTAGGGEMFDEKQTARFVDILVGSGLLAEDQRATLDAETALVLIDKAAARMKGLEPQAEDGRKYREDLIASAIQEGIRAHGNDFNADKYKRLLSSAPLEDIKSVATDFKKVADAVLPAGRATTDEGTEDEKTVQVPVPDYIFA